MAPMQGSAMAAPPNSAPLTMPVETAAGRHFFYCHEKP